MKKLPAVLIRQRYSGVADSSTELRGEDALCYREPCAFPLTGATASCPHRPRRAHSPRATRELQQRLGTDARNFFFSPFLAFWDPRAAFTHGAVALLHAVKSS